VPEPVVLQKLLTGAVAAAIVERGSDHVGGYVTLASEVARLRTPRQLLAAYGVDGAPEFADVVRFEQPRLATLARPGPAERPWQTFPNGFLLGDSLARVWVMGRTRYSYGAEYWRIRSDGEQKCLSNYAGVARGWAGARQWRPPSPIIGTMARWRGGEFFADVRAGSVLLSAITGDGPSGFEQVRPGAWVSTVPVSECQIFERVFTAEVDGLSVRLLRRSASQADVLLLSDDPAEAARIGATLVEPGVYEATVETSRLANTQGVENQLTGATE
jgi:hypothetical protein